MPDVERPNKNEDGDEVRPEDSAHDGDYVHLVYDVTVPGPGPCSRTGPGGVEDVESSGGLARAHVERCGKLVSRAQNVLLDSCC